MKLSKSYIKQIIMEELQKLDEGINLTPSQEKNSMNNLKNENPELNSNDLALVKNLQDRIDSTRNKPDGKIPDVDTLKAEYTKKYSKFMKYLNF